ncbi:hypothetical protein ABIB00_002142 [Bradyrhizobium sp. LB14.3]|uniref:hypothetical protein n=1 Tax=Bradyrhizobium sp. LB14.3 TaxID=3156328 RepID=UPI00339736B2
MHDDKRSTSLLSPAHPPYIGAAWRARFLRAPKVGLELAARPDFVPLAQLATIKLGLKTGADGFFFLERIEDASEGKQLISRRGLVTVEGMDGWRGEVSTSDLKPAVLNPHQLFVGSDRSFRIPEVPKHYYIYPRAGKLRHGLGEYVKLGELKGIHTGELVKSNASDVGWYRQVRALVAGEWVLPYNSAYDYGAWHNPSGAILNGRFVGVEPHDQQSSELLGAVLNSTFAAIGRLLEGVATGVEGAFDVGPPAARRIMVPDFRRFSDVASKKILKAFESIRKGGKLVPAPSSDGVVGQLRRDLDTTLLVGLGLSAGQSAALLERLYTSYGRWRASIENVETQMRANRRQMHATGQTRDQKPVEVAGKRVWEEIEHEIRLYPKDLLSNAEVMEVVNVPSSVGLPDTEPLFDGGVIHLKNKVVDLGAYDRVRYVEMLRVLGIVGSIEVPTSTARARAICDLFEKDQKRFSELALAQAAKYISGGDAVSEVVEVARKHWYSASRKSALTKKVKEKSLSKKHN